MEPQKLIWVAYENTQDGQRPRWWSRMPHPTFMENGKLMVLALLQSELADDGPPEDYPADLWAMTLNLLHWEKPLEEMTHQPQTQTQTQTLKPDDAGNA